MRKFHGINFCDFRSKLRTKRNFLPAKVSSFKITLLSAPVSSKLPFCKTALLRTQLISPILFCLPKSGQKKKRCSAKSWQSEDMLIVMFALRLALEIIFQNFVLISEKAVISKTTGSKDFCFSFARSLARL